MPATLRYQPSTTSVFSPACLAAADARDDAIDSLRGLLAQAERLAAALETTALGSDRPEEMTAADGAASLVALAIDHLRDGIARLRDLTEADLAAEIAAAADEGRAALRESVR